MQFPGVPKPPQTPEPATPADDHWFTSGIAVFQGSRRPAALPPLDDHPAQRHWLGGFGAAWAECPPGGTGWCSHSLDVALMLVLEGRAALLAQLCSHGLPPHVVY